MWDRIKRLGAATDALATTLAWSPRSQRTIVAVLEQRARRDPDAPFLWFEGRRWSIGAFNAIANQHADAYHRIGVRRGEIVSLVIDNRPEMLFHLFGLAKLGAIASLTNHNLRGQPLAHALQVTAPRAVVTVGPFARAVDEALGGHPLPVYRDEPDPELEPASADERVSGQRDWAEALAGARSDDPVRTPELTLDDVMAYIFTSGTTGLPKAARVKHNRFYRAGHIMGGFARATADDCIYCCLPLYHSNAAVIATSIALLRGPRLALARRFSASRFWRECAAAGATMAIYIGEVCRYLYRQPPSADDRAHRVTRLLGNGLRPDIWEPFCQRFGIERVCEFYGSTEGNAETINAFNTPGSCGPLLPRIHALVRYDIDKQQVVRDARGLCIPVDADEPGLLLGSISGRNDFGGYTDADATESKVLCDVKKRGDRWFNSGDLLRRDHLRRLYFVDRIGDTFRFKGENVSTQEVAEALCQAQDVAQAVVYGVQVPHTDGRAGMAAIVTARDGALDGARLFRQVAAGLPTYAQPRFVRVVRSLETTGTHKYRKATLLQQGFDPTRVGDDPLLVRDPQRGAYVLLSPELHRRIVAGEWPL